MTTLGTLLKRQRERHGRRNDAQDRQNDAKTHHTFLDCIPMNNPWGRISSTTSMMM